MEGGGVTAVLNRPATAGRTAPLPLHALPPIVTLAEVDLLGRALLEASRGVSMLLHLTRPAGDARSIGPYVTAVRRICRVFAYAAGRPVIAVCESGDGDAAMTDPFGLYLHAAATTNTLRSLLADPAAHREAIWPESVARPAFLPDVERAHRYATALGGGPLVALRTIFTSRRTTLPACDRDLVRSEPGPAGPRVFAGSAHLLRPRGSATPTGRRGRTGVGEPAGPVANPIGLDVGPGEGDADLLEAAPRIGTGPLVVTCRCAAGPGGRQLSALVGSVATRVQSPVWQCDPFAAAGGVRDASAVAAEYGAFLDVLATLGLAPGGLRIDLARSGLRWGMHLVGLLATVLHDRT
jgi:3-deoxy-D-arabino-heptulosonate 7-phosphate (DAHP) synthase class II